MKEADRGKKESRERFLILVLGSGWMYLMAKIIWQKQMKKNYHMNLTKKNFM